MVKKYVHVITHGDKFAGENPRMTEKGYAQIEAMKRHPNCLPLHGALRTYCGTGQRHFDVAHALNLIPDEYNGLYGDPDSLEVNEDGDRIVFFACGRAVPAERYTALKTNANFAKALVSSLPSDSVICAGRPLMIMLGRPDGKSAAVYQVVIEDDLDGNCQIIEINELMAAGDIDPALK